MYTNTVHKSRSGFTLIELLIVIVLIGILSGVLLAVIQPGAQRSRANEAVAKSNLDKIRMAMLSCISSRSDPLNSCITFEGIGANDPSGNPLPETTYYVSKSNQASFPNSIYAQVCLTGGTSYDYCTGCAMRYIFDVNSANFHTNSGKVSKYCSIDF